MAVETTLILIKPDAVQRGLIGDIVTRFERKGLTVAGMRFLTADEETAGKHYEVHKRASFLWCFDEIHHQLPFGCACLTW